MTRRKLNSSPIETTSLDPGIVEAMLLAAPDGVNDPDCAYDPADARAIHAFWKNSVVVRGGGLAAVSSALARRRTHNADRP